MHLVFDDGDVDRPLRRRLLDGNVVSLMLEGGATKEESDLQTRIPFLGGG